MAKFFGRIGKDRVKMIVDFTAVSLSVSTHETIYLKLTVKRGDQKPEEF